MPSSNPLRKAFDTAERIVGRPVEEIVQAPRTSYVLLSSGRIALWGWREVRRAHGRVINLCGLPSERDVRRLSAQLLRLQRTVDEIEQQIYELPPPKQLPPPRDSA